MNAHLRSSHTPRPGSLVFVFVALLMGVLPATGIAQSVREAQAGDAHHVAISAPCITYTDNGREVIDSACAAAVDAAEEEAAGWPDLDSTALGDQVRRIELAQAAAAEASSWPDLDSTALGDQVRRIELAQAAAAEEAAGWPTLDSLNPGPAQHTQEVAHGNGISIP